MMHRFEGEGTTFLHNFLVTSSSYQVEDKPKNLLNERFLQQIKT